MLATGLCKAAGQRKDARAHKTKVSTSHGSALRLDAVYHVVLCYYQEGENDRIHEHQPTVASMKAP